METLNKKAHKTSNYLIRDNNGKLHVYTYRPTDPYTGRKDSDQYALALGLKINNPSHELWLGEIACTLVLPSHSGFSTINVKCEIVAKKSLIWDYSKPIGQRESETKTSKFWDMLFVEYLQQSVK